jgi:hypothetical protein
LVRYVSNSPTNYTDPSGNFRLSLGPPPVTSPSPVTPPPGVGVGVGVGVGTGAAAGTEAGLGAAIGGGLLLAAATVGFWLLTTDSEILDRRGNVVDYGYVYKIRRPPNGRDVYLEIGNGEPNRKEIAFEGGFSRQYIESYRKVEGQKKSGEYILGPSKPFPR